MSTLVWRLSKRRYKTTAFSGEGGRRVAGRWNSKGTGLVYTSGTLSLAALELFVHLEVEDVTTQFVALKAEIPDKLPRQEIDVSTLRPDWRRTPAPSALAELADNWFRTRSTLVLVVPSAVIPQEKNYLLNPEHPDFQRVIISAPEEFALDPRLWKQS